MGIVCGFQLFFVGLLGTLLFGFGLALRTFLEYLCYSLVLLSGP